MSGSKAKAEKFPRKYVQKRKTVDQEHGLYRLDRVLDVQQRLQTELKRNALRRKRDEIFAVPEHSPRRYIGDAFPTRFRSKDEELEEYMLLVEEEDQSWAERNARWATEAEEVTGNKKPSKSRRRNRTPKWFKRSNYTGPDKKLDAKGWLYQAFTRKEMFRSKGSPLAMDIWENIKQWGVLPVPAATDYRVNYDFYPENTGVCAPRSMPDGKRRCLRGETMERKRQMDATAILGGAGRNGRHTPLVHAKWCLLG